MASLTTCTPAAATIKGLGGSSLAGTKLSVKPSRLSFRPNSSYRAGAVVAKYGDKSVYFDLEDLGNTTGQWDVYGSDAPSPYNSLQVYIPSIAFGTGTVPALPVPVEPAPMEPAPMVIVSGSGSQIFFNR